METKAVLFDSLTAFRAFDNDTSNFTFRLDNTLRQNAFGVIVAASLCHPLAEVIKATRSLSTGLERIGIQVASSCSWLVESPLLAHEEGQIRMKIEAIVDQQLQMAFGKLRRDANLTSALARSAASYCSSKACGIILPSISCSSIYPQPPAHFCDGGLLPVRVFAVNTLLVTRRAGVLRGLGHEFLSRFAHQSRRVIDRDQRDAWRRRQAIQTALARNKSEFPPSSSALQKSGGLVLVESMQ